MNMEVPRPASTRVFATPELFECIFSFILERLHTVAHEEDPRSVKIYKNARTLQHILAASQVNRTWYRNITQSKPLQRALFLLADNSDKRAWEHTTRTRQTLESSTKAAPVTNAPLLNPIIQARFPSYNFRFYESAASVYAGSDIRVTKHYAFIMITRRDLPTMVENGNSLANMLLSQPPCTFVEAKIYEERDETKEYVGQTLTLEDPDIKCPEGITLGMLHGRVKEIFERYSDVVAIKLMTL